ncbi:GNAT family N-acetyltransferase [Janibacter terrae]|uniref:GNAT family N-acetyltransferase n=1 Tax=Janibacter terrae TaxID=103817 RepID=A0ABZ2FBL9_9MICO|nr:GNAT family N-acetyltransferase [Janibacter terrae]
MRRQGRLMVGGWAVRRLTPDEWQLHRAVRLAMLLDEPRAYGSSFGREVGFDEATWRERLGHPVFLAARGDGLPLGAATLYTPQPGGEPEIVAMWVAGHARGSGVADALVEACVAEAARRGAPRVLMHVMADNPRAAAMYARAGFSFDGVRAEDDEACERMSRDLRSTG